MALLGRAGAGKSTVREVLFEAIQKASDNKITIKQFIISPKSMSRQELLGYVDPVTKEWNDGALSRAARAAV